MGHQSLLPISPIDLLEEKRKGVELLARNTNWDKGRIEGEEGGVVKEESQFIELGLGICANGYGGPSHVTIKQGKGPPPITPSQLHELNQQALIFKYIVAGTPVPFPLVFPIWKSVASSFGSGGGIYKQFPSFIGFSPRGIDYRSLMDPEPRRCRRTDGKKWRCGKNVVPDQKYCERHMHRGRLRSRKPVEAAENISQSNTPTTPCSNKTKQTIKFHDPADINTKFPVPGNHQMSSFKRSNDFPATVPSTTTSANGNSNVFVSSVTTKPGAINNGNINNCSTDIITTTVTNTFHDADTDNAIDRNNSKYVDGKDAGFNHSNDKKNDRNIKNGNNQSGFVTPGFVFTLKSVRHDYTKVEPQRCRRTDGKKWRCSRDVVPQQKYCDSHMHRGAKRLVVSQETVTVAAASPPVAVPKNDHINLNITVDSPQPTSDDVNNSTSGSSSDATTVTDENTSVSHLLALSP